MSSDIPADHRRLSTSRDARRLRPCYVYRCYDSAGVLLYVGNSVNPVARVEDHRSAWWGKRIFSTRLIVFPDRDYALDKERQAIWAERPACNVKGRWYVNDPREDWTLEEYQLLRHAVIKTARGLIGISTARLIERIDNEVLDRFGVTILGVEATA